MPTGASATTPAGVSGGWRCPKGATRCWRWFATPSRWWRGPPAERWMLRGGARGPDGEAVPLLAMSQETGAQLVVQTTDGIHDIRLLARMLMENLAGESRVHVEDLQRVLARGGEAYGFSFTV